MQLTLVVTHACNLRCTYCYTGLKKPVRMPADTARRAIDFALTQRPQELLLSYFGGEPLLEFPLLKEITPYASERCRSAGASFRIIMTTNGTLLGDETLATLAAWPLELSVSLDAAHDRTRPFADGRGSFAEVRDGLRRALPLFPDLNVVMVVDPANVAALADTVPELVALGARRIRFSVNFLATWGPREREVLAGEIARAADLYAEGFRRGAPVSMSAFDDRLRAHLQGGTDPAGHCDLGDQEVAVAPSGFLYPCERMVGEDTDASARIGHLDRGFDAARRAYFAGARPAPGADLPSLGLPACGSWCGCTNYLVCGSPDRVPEFYRWYQERVIHEARRVGAALFQERNPFFLGIFYGEEDLLAQAIAGRTVTST